MTSSTPVFALALVLALGPGDPPGAAGTAQGAADEALASLRRSLGEHGIRLDLEHGFVVLPVRVLIREELLEYLLVGPRGQLHESLFVTEVQPSLVNAALLALGLEPGKNASWVQLEPAEAAPPAEGADARDDRPDFRVVPPEGDGLYLYAGWREGEEVFLYRVDDLISNLATRRSLPRHRWVFLGSRFATLREGEPEVFVADVEGNLINLSFFFQGNTLITAALPECEEQTIWVANAWLLPPRDTEVALFLSKERLESAGGAWQEALPVHAARTSGAAQPADAR